MDAVKATIESLGGGVELRTEAGRGTTTTFFVPITAAVQRVLLVRIADERVALPIAKVERILELSDDSIEEAVGDSFALIDDEPIPVFRLARANFASKRTNQRKVPCISSSLKSAASASHSSSIVSKANRKFTSNPFRTCSRQFGSSLA